MQAAAVHARLIILITLPVIFMSCASGQKTESPLYDAMLQVLLSDKVPVITVDELKQNPDRFHLFDVREAGEYSVSRIEGAIHIPPGEDQVQQALPSDLDKSAPIVVYCSVGYRSEKLTEVLQGMGYNNVRNLYGGIFEWVNRGYPVVDDSGSTERVHAYNFFWGAWLTRGEKVF